MTKTTCSPKRPTTMLVRTMWRPRLRRQYWSISTSLVLLASAPLHAEPFARELGDNLRYFRAHILPTDLPSPDIKTGPSILDLRYTLAEAEATTELDVWLKFRATATTPVIVLINSATAPALRELLVSHANRTGVITIGRASADTTPDITIESTGDEERRAYAALEHSSSIESLITENADKPRNDEATIMRARADPNGGQTDTSSPDGVTPAGKKAEPPPPLLIDHALQRAVQLHRALLALKRI